VKLEANFLRDYDAESYPVDSYEEMEFMFHTHTQVDKFISTIEGCVYRLKQ
jgi:C4-type Zn-finger protein